MQHAGGCMVTACLECQTRTTVNPTVKLRLVQGHAVLEDCSIVIQLLDLASTVHEHQVMSSH